MTAITDEVPSNGFFSRNRNIILSSIVSLIIGGCIGALVLSILFRPGNAIVKNAAINHTIGAVLVGDDGVGDVINTLTGEPFIDCSKEPCRSKIVEENGNVFLVDSKSGERINASVTDTRSFRWKGSHCEAHSSSGVHRERCCTSIFNC